jgi:uncharacterized protein DUF3592
VQKRSAIDSSGLPAALLKATPRHVRVSALGGLMLVIAGVLVVAGMWGGIVLGRRAEIAERHLGLFASERIVAAGDIIQLRKRGGDDDPRITAHYRYTARGQELTGETTLRRDERERYVVGSPVGVWYLPSEPEASWLDGHAPRAEASWPATAVPMACGVTALVLIQLVRRQSNLLAYGRPAMATVTKVVRKRTDKGTFWMVHYEWTTISGATRAGKYKEGKRHVPAVGDLVPIVYDRDNTFRSSKYPMALVTIRPSVGG